MEDLGVGPPFYRMKPSWLTAQGFERSDSCNDSDGGNLHTSSGEQGHSSVLGWGRAIADDQPRKKKFSGRTASKHGIPPPDEGTRCYQRVPSARH